MTSLADVVAQLQDALAKAAEGQAALRQAGMFAQDAIDLVKLVGVGSVHEAEYEQVSAEWACVVEVPAKLDEVLDAACGRVERYLLELTGGDAASAPGPAPLHAASSPGRERSMEGARCDAPPRGLLLQRRQPGRRTRDRGVGVGAGPRPG